MANNFASIVVPACRNNLLLDVRGERNSCDVLAIISSFIWSVLLWLDWDSSFRLQVLFFITCMGEGEEHRCYRIKIGCSIIDGFCTY